MSTLVYLKILSSLHLSTKAKAQSEGQVLWGESIPTFLNINYIFLI
jgi:hypothetical protein